MNSPTIIDKPEASISTAPVASPLKRFGLATLGVLFVVVAGVGVLLPGIPTVGPLLLAPILFTKSCPSLEKRLVRNRFFARYLPYLDGTKELSLKAKMAAIATMWTSIVISGGVFYLALESPLVALIALAIAGLIGTVFILRFGKTKNGNSNSN